MKIVEEDLLIRIYLSEKTKYEGKPLYQLLFNKAREIGLAGATILRGMMGFGADRRVHSANFVDISDNLPLVLEIIDKEENLVEFFNYIDKVVTDGFITIEKVHVLKYRHNT